MELFCDPTPVVFLPLGQGLHSVEPPRLLYVPLAHGWHGDDVSFTPDGEKVPGRH